LFTKKRQDPPGYAPDLFPIAPPTAIVPRVEDKGVLRIAGRRPHRKVFLKGPLAPQKKPRGDASQSQGSAAKIINSYPRGQTPQLFSQGRSSIQNVFNLFQLSLPRRRGRAVRRHESHPMATPYGDLHPNPRRKGAIKAVRQGMPPRAGDADLQGDLHQT